MKKYLKLSTKKGKKNLLIILGFISVFKYILIIGVE